jgi:hypothetical protein
MWELQKFERQWRRSERYGIDTPDILVELEETIIRPLAPSKKPCGC